MLSEAIEKKLQEFFTQLLLVGFALFILLLWRICRIVQRFLKWMKYWLYDFGQGLINSEHYQEELVNLALRFHRCLLLIELDNGKYWYVSLYERYHEEDQFMNDSMNLKEAKLIEIPNGIVRDTCITRKGRQVAYIIKHHGKFPPRGYY